MILIAATALFRLFCSFHLGSQTKPTNQPMLTNEFHQVTTKIFNQSDLCLQNVGVSISVPQLLRNNGN